MDLDSLTAGLRERLGENSGIDATIKFDLGADGVIFVDGASVPNTVTNTDSEAQCTVQVTLEDFQNIAKGDLDAMTAFMMGKLKISGDMGVAMKLREIL